MSEWLWIVSDKDSAMDALLKSPEYADDANDCERSAFYTPAGGWSGTDAEGFIDKTHVRPANLPETKELDKMTDDLEEGTRVQADKGFFSANNKAM